MLEQQKKGSRSVNLKTICIVALNLHHVIAQKRYVPEGTITTPLLRRKHLKNELSQLQERSDFFRSGVLIIAGSLRDVRSGK